MIGHLAGAMLAGAERSLLDILAAIDRRKYEVCCVLPTRDDAYIEAISRYTHEIEVLDYGWWRGAPHGDPEMVTRFAELFQRKRIDLVHVNTITLLDPLLAARKLGVPSVVHARELIFHNPELAQVLGNCAAAVVTTVRSAADFVIANSDTTHDVFRKEGRSFRLYGCVDPVAFDMGNDVVPGHLKVGIISSNAAHKGIDLFVQLAILAARRNLAIEFVVVGPSNEMTEQLARWAQFAGVPVKIRFAGYIPNPADAMREVNVVASFSIVPESFGRTIAEAMMARRPVIAFDYGAPPELIRHGQDGFIVPYLKVDHALAHLESLAGHPNEVAAMGASARARAEKLFSPAEFASGLDAIYQCIIESGRDSPRQGWRVIAPALAEA